MLKDIEKIVIRYMEDFFNKQHNERIDFSFENIEGFIYLFIQLANGKVIKKVNLNLDITYLNEFYYNLYQEFKKRYLNSMTKKVKVQEITDLTNIENPYLMLIIRDIHKNIIRLELKNHEYAKESLLEIKSDWIETIKEFRYTKIR